MTLPRNQSRLRGLGEAGRLTASLSLLGSTLNESKSETEKWMPTMSGNCVAYEPQYRAGTRTDDGIAWQKWKRIPTEDAVNPHGIPYPSWSGQLFAAIGLKGYEQAQAIAWSFLAHQKATPQGIIEARVVPYEFKYDLKAKELEDGAILCKAEA